MKKILLYMMLVTFASIFCYADTVQAAPSAPKVEYKEKSIGDLFRGFYKTTGINAFLNPTDGLKDSSGHELSKFTQSWGRIIMFFVCFLLFYLAIKKGFEPLLLLPIGFGGLLANIPIAEIAGPNGFLGIIYGFGIESGLFPLIIFMGVGAMTDFGPLLANPKTAMLGGAAQFGIFATLIGALALSQHTSIFNFSLADAAAIGIIGGADGPTAIFLASRLAPDLLGAIAVAAYSYMALVPIIQPPIMRALTTKEERKIRMVQLREVSKREKIIFPITILMLCVLVLPDATPLIGALAFGNLVRECGVVQRLSDTMQNALINIVTIFLGLSVGSKLAAEKFLVPNTLGILMLGLVAFSIGTAAGIIMAKIMNKFSKDKINPLIGAAGVSAVPMAARVANKEGIKEDCTNILLMHAMGPNVSGVIGSAVAAGVLLSIFK
ncbi:sodium ion-translocating decarboxylase subunit beta [Campylobacter californiensis]|uniref:sodium ion-translocating decarboxylase subunit beta n=1 Tax=Campylobacter californiensis TaxID=1032243 RepID=UPI0014760A98|nr:sodium ion-translocating decarboxylase subunit beta [Campylobacter sp. RM12916]MBE3609834.1 sodium ion-translocating decarboxylase subunit beta [Campylobacter sp. RM12916]